MAASAKLGRPSGYRNQRSVDVLLTLRINSAPRCFTGTPGDLADPCRAAVHGRARQILRNVDDGAEDIAAIGRSESGFVRIGIFSSIASGFLAELLRAYHRAHPRVQVELIDGNPSEHVAAIRQFSLDVAFLTGTRLWSDCDTSYFWSERVFAVLPEDHSLAARDEVDWTDLVDETFIVNDVAPGREIHDYLVQRLAGLGQHPRLTSILSDERTCSHSWLWAAD